MNRCFFIGKVCSNIKFDFILKGRNISIARFYIKLLDDNIIKVKGYNEIADYCYKNLKEGTIITLEGYLDFKMKVNLEVIEILK